MGELFSKRFNIPIENKEIVIRYEVTDDMRSYVYLIMKNQGIGLKKIREIVCRTIKRAPDQNQYTENDYMDYEIQKYFMSCPWNRIYDIIENFSRELPKTKLPSFENDINDYFYENGIGWKLENCELLSRGDDAFEYAVQSLGGVLGDDKQTTKSEIVKAIKCLSIREEPDLTGAVQHSMAALECLSRHITGGKETLGELIKKNPHFLPPALGEGIRKLYGFASNNGRHLLEGKEPEFGETELIVHLSAALCTYLGNKLSKRNDEIEDTDYLFR